MLVGLAISCRPWVYIIIPGFRRFNIVKDVFEEVVRMSDYNIGAKIKELRRSKKLTLQDVANETGFSTALLSQIENNNVSPPIATLSKISHFFDVKIGYFFAESEEECPYDKINLVKRYPSAARPDADAPLEEALHAVAEQGSEAEQGPKERSVDACVVDKLDGFHKCSACEASLQQAG